MSESCTEPDCTRPVKARGLCGTHYVYAYRHGTLPPKAPAPEGCTVPDCDEPHEARGLCARHYLRWYTRGSTELTEPQRAMSVEDRFWAKVDKSAGPEGCWLWTAGKIGQGYGAFYAYGRKFLAHRFAYQLTIGPLSDLFQVDHVRERGCRHRHCVNPAHLEVVTLAENLRRAPPGRRTENGKNQRARWAEKAELRFWAKVDKSAGLRGCWLWEAFIDGSGSAKAWWQGSTHMAREVAWLLAKGPVPDGYIAQQTCGRGDCVNPAHLKVVSRQQDLARRAALARAAKSR
jgi:hypothetical protein